MREYELMFIVNPQLGDEEIQKTVERISTVITDRAGEISKVQTEYPWGRRKLAYPIQRLREGYYTLVQFKLEPAKTDELENSLRLSEDILRHLVIRVGE